MPKKAYFVAETISMSPTPAQRIATRRLKISAILCLGLLLVDIIGQFLTGQQYLLPAVVSSIMLLIAVGIFLLKRYWWAILLVAITLVGNRYLY